MKWSEATLSPARAIRRAGAAQSRARCSVRSLREETGIVATARLYVFQNALDLLCKLLLRIGFAETRDVDIDPRR